MRKRSLIGITAALALGVVAPGAFSQERASWRPDAPARPEAPPELAQPEFKFEIDRASLMSTREEAEPETRTRVSTGTARPELGRVATWRERVSGTDRRRSGRGATPGGDELPESAGEEQPDEAPESNEPPAREPKAVAALTPPAERAAAPVAKPPSSVSEGYKLKPSRPVEPAYPREAYLDGTEGWVDVEFVVAPDGSVMDAQIIDAEPRRVFEKSAIRAADQWRFDPPQVSGVETPQRATYRFEFTMGG